MPARGTLELFGALAACEGREHAAQALAAHLGATALFAFVVDETIGGALVPAPGFASTVPGGAGWRDILSRARVRGQHAAEVRYPDARTTAPAHAFAYEGVTLVFVGGAVDPAHLDGVAPVVPLLAGVLRAEYSAHVAAAEARLAHESAQQASNLAAALDEARSLAEAATRVKDDFLAMLGHELRNPLAPIVTALELLRLKGIAGREHDVIERQVAHLRRLIDDLLDVSRITRGNVDLHRQTIEAAELVATAVEMVAPLVDERRQRLSVDVPPAGVPVDADPARFAQVLSNLLTNASRYSDAGSRIDVRAWRHGLSVRFEVADQGVGIDPRAIDRIFDQFVQGDHSTGRKAGLGLGLAIVRSLVALHGGRVWATSGGRGQGSVFTVEVPAADTASASAPSDAGPVRATLKR